MVAVRVVLIDAVVFVHRPGGDEGGLAIVPFGVAQGGPPGVFGVFSGELVGGDGGFKGGGRVGVLHGLGGGELAPGFPADEQGDELVQAVGQGGEGGAAGHRGVVLKRFGDDVFR